MDSLNSPLSLLYPSLSCHQYHFTLINFSYPPSPPSSFFLPFLAIDITLHWLIFLILPLLLPYFFPSLSWHWYYVTLINFSYSPPPSFLPSISALTFPSLLCPLLLLTVKQWTWWSSLLLSASSASSAQPRRSYQVESGPPVLSTSWTTSTWGLSQLLAPW